jgi:hypothetical protein
MTSAKRYRSVSSLRSRQTERDMLVSRDATRQPGQRCKRHVLGHLSAAPKRRGSASRQCQGDAMTPSPPMPFL